MLPKPIRHGQPLKSFPADTFNALVDGRLNDLRDLTSLEDLKKPKEPSPVIVQLIWTGESAVPEGNIVKLGSSFYDPTTVAYAPFSGLKFNCGSFVTNEPIVDYAITMGPIAAGAIGFGIMPEAYWAQVVVSNSAHMYAAITTAGTLLTSAGSGTLRIIWKPTGTGTKWCVLAMAGSAADSYQIVRGVTTATVLDTDATFTITSLVALEDHSLSPADPLTVINIGAKAHASGDLVYAIKVAAASTWEELAGGASSGAPLRRFKYTTTKTTSSTTATVRWIDDTNTIVGGDVTVYDPESQFNGQIVSYVSGEPGMLGVALLRHDLATSSPAADRWEIIASEGYAEFIICTWYSTGNGHFVSNESIKDPWNRRNPALVGGLITIADPAALLPTSPATTLKLVCRLGDPNTSPPTYDVVGLLSTGGSSSIRSGRVYSTITSASGNLVAHWGGGSIKYTDNATGVLDASATTVTNNSIGIGYPVDAQVWVDTAYSPPKVLYGTCLAVTGWE